MDNCEEIKFLTFLILYFQIFLILNGLPGATMTFIRCIIVFCLYVFFQGVLCIFLPSCTYIYIWAQAPHINTSVIHNMVYKVKFF
jgi:hypothetical protein